MKRYLYLARHGETDWNAIGRWQGHTDIPLNDQGRVQARALAALLVGTKITTVISSDLSRAHETATIVASTLQVGQVRIDPALRERSYGVFEGLTRADCEARYPEPFRAWMSESRELPPGAESNDALALRVVAAMRRVADERVVIGQPALIVSHGGSLRAMLRAAGDASALSVPNAALFRIECEGSAFVRAQRIEAPGA